MCTSFAVYHQEKAVYGMNFDTDDIDLKLKISSYNDMNLFYFSALLENKYRDIAYFNSEGLFILTQAVEYGPSFKASCDENNWFAFDIFDEALKKTRKASEFFEILNKRVISYPRNPLFPALGLHTMIADKTGDAFILEEGNGTNIVSPVHNDFSQKNTLCTIVYEPIKNEIYISFKKDLSKKWKISVTDKTIQSMDGFLSNNKIQLTNDEVLVNDLISLYK